MAGRFCVVEFCVVYFVFEEAEDGMGSFGVENDFTPELKIKGEFVLLNGWLFKTTGFKVLDLLVDVIGYFFWEKFFN